MTRALAAALSAAFFLALVPGGKAWSAEPGYLERSVCGWLTERLGFFLLHRIAGEPRLGPELGREGLEKVHFRTRDDRTLRGYKLIASAPEGAAPRGYLLVAQGNAMLAEHTIPLLRFFAAAGFDAYAFDFRGYGMSEGRSRLAAILSDYVEIIRFLNRQGYARRLLYGTSLGGVIFLHAIGAGVSYDAAAIDSAPSSISNYGCPDDLAPVRNVPPDGARLLMIVGGLDRVVPPPGSRELADLVEARGGAVVRRADFAHPFQDAMRDTVLARWGLVLDFFDRIAGGR